MTMPQATSTKGSSRATQSGRLFLLELSGDRIHSMNPDGSDRVFVDVDTGYIYWINMGVPNDQVVMSRTPGFFRTVLLPRGSSKPEWLAR